MDEEKQDVFEESEVKSDLASIEEVSASHGLAMFEPYLTGDLSELPDELQKWTHNGVNKLVLAQAIQAIESIPRVKKLTEYVAAAESMLFDVEALPEMDEDDLRKSYKLAVTQLTSLQESIRKFCAQNKEIEKADSPKEQLVIQALNTPIEDLKALVDQAQGNKEAIKELLPDSSDASKIITLNESTSSTVDNTYVANEAEKKDNIF